MLRQFEKLFLLTPLLLCVSCAKGDYRNQQKKLSILSEKQDIKKIADLVLSTKFLPDEKSKFLKNLEIGNAMYMNGNYCQAAAYFDKASDIEKEQRTKSISSAITSGVGVGDDIYYGESYEKAMLKFYQSLNNYYIYNSGMCEKQINNNTKKTDGEIVSRFGYDRKLSDSEKRTALYASRASILELDSWLKGRNIEKNDRLYIDDVLSKLWGAFIHETIGTSTDLQIAKQLYKDAQNIALSKYAVYKTFNKNNDKFVENLDIPEKGANYVDKDNRYVKAIIDYSNQQLKRIENGKTNNFGIIISDEAISAKDVEVQHIPIGILFASSPKMYLMAEILGIKNVTYELPVLREKPVDAKYVYTITKDIQKNNKIEQEIVKTGEVVLAEPLSDIAYMSLQEKISSIKTSIIASVTAKYIAALVASSITYEVFKQTNETLGVAMALGTFKANKKMIDEGAKVDIRQWVSLPSNIFLYADNIKEGEYKLNVKKIYNNGNVKNVYDKSLKITNDCSFIDIRVAI